MKPQAILAFLKKNLISVICIVVALIAAPVMFFFSNQMTNDVVEDVQSAVSSKAGEVQRNSRINYTIPATSTEQEAWSESGSPHAETIEQVIAVMQAHNASSDRVQTLIRERNQQDKPLLLAEDTQRLLPEPADEGSRVELLTTLINRYPAYHAELLAELNFGLPPNPQEVAEELRAIFDQQVGVAAQANEDLEATEEQVVQITQGLSSRRIAIYRERAQELLAYASPDIFARLEQRSQADIPDLDEAWWWQMYAWAHRDIMQSLARANNGGSLQRQPMNAVGGPLKRILFIGVRQTGESPTWSAGEPGERPRGGGGRGGGRGGGFDDFGQEQTTGPVTPALAQPLPRNYDTSLTGRAGWPNATNGYYDTFFVDIELLADPNRLEQIINAIQSVNLQTVVELSYESVDPYIDLEQGFFYGDNALARVRMTVETVWLRSWLGDLMPPGIREELQLPPRETPNPNADGGE